MDIKILEQIILSLLKSLGDAVFSAKFKTAADHAASFLDSHGHSYPSNPTDADKQAFVKRALFRIWHQFFGGDPADKARDFFLPAVEDAAMPQLAAIMSTAQACEVVGAAQVTALENLQNRLVNLKIS